MRAKFITFFAIIMLSLGLQSCTKKPTVFDIVGEWGITETTFYWNKDVVNAEPSHSVFTNNYYWQFWDFQINGALIVRDHNRNVEENGDFIYNTSKRKLTYRFYDNIYDAYRDADVTIVSPIEMIVTTHTYASDTVYKMKKLKW